MMSQWSWTYMLVPLGDLGNELPTRRYDWTETDEDGNVTTVRAKFSTASRTRKCGLGAASDTHRIFKCSNLSFQDGDVQAFQNLGYTLMSQAEAAAWSATLSGPDQRG
tara:strand:+ start:123 stop:446 length:324 start_codon:yes stop_codon:yes gene_type:complete